MRYAYLLIIILSISCKTAQVVESQTEVDQPELVVENTIEADSLDYHPIKDYRTSRSRYFDLLHTKLNISFDWENEWVIGKAHLELKPFFYQQESLLLDAKGFSINRVALIDGLDTTNVIYQYDKEILFIDFERSISRNETIHLYIDYIAKPNERESSSGTAITDNKGLYFINADGADPYKPIQIWTQGEPESNSAWYPTIDAPNERTTQEIIITVSDSLQTLSNGELTSSVRTENGKRIDHWKLDKPHAPYLAMIAVGEFDVVKDSRASVPVSYYAEKGKGDLLQEVFKNTPEMISFFEDKLGYKYPWPKYDQIVVRDFVSGAMENTSASVFMEDVLISKKQLLDENWDYIIAHELFHQWFGNLVTCESWSHLPLNESFASFGEQLWIEHKYGFDEANYHVITERDSYFSEAEEVMEVMIRHYYDDPDDMFDNHSYAKGGLILRMLRGYLGDEAFFESLNRYLKANAFQSVEIHDLRLAFERTTGEDLSWFFDQWFFKPGHPIVRIDDAFENDTLTVNIEQIQNLDLLPLYKLPTTLDIYTAKGIYQYPIIVSDILEEVKIPMKEKPDLVLLDGDFLLVGEIVHEKTLDELIFQLQNGDNLIGRYEAFVTIAQSEDLEKTKEAIQIGLNDPNFRIRSLALEFLQSEPDYLVNPEIAELVKSQLNDSTADVRSSALYTLILFDVDNATEYVKAGISDEAYSVQGVALEGLLELQTEERDSVFTTFREETQIDILLPVADYVNRTQSEDGFDWYINKLNQINGTNKFYLLQYFAEFILASDASKQEIAVELLRDFAINQQDYLVRLSSFQIIALLNDSNLWTDYLIEIVNNEKDSRLIDYYNQIEID